jgi:hypothetical protein
MVPTPSRGWLIVIGALLVTTTAVRGDDGKTLEEARSSAQAKESELRVCREAIQAYRETVVAAQSKELAPLRRAVETAEKAVADAHTAAGLDALREKREKTREAREAKVESLLANAPAFQAAKTRLAELEKQIADLEKGTGRLKEPDLLALAQLRLEKDRLGYQMYKACKAWWKRGEVEAEFKAADDAYKAYNAASEKAANVKQANADLKTARKALETAIAELPLDTPIGKALQGRCAELEAAISAANARISELEKNWLDGAKTATVTIKVYDRKTKGEIDQKVSMWLPPKHDYIRGVVIAHPMIKNLATARPMQLVAAREGLGLMVFGDFARSPEESLRILDDLLAKLATESGHPELRGAPLLLGGLSASVLATRDIACFAPQRVFGVVHAAGGNMQEMPDDGRGMVEVPFFAQNGEFEWCGPAGGGHSSGAGGIRPQYGNQTQWVMIREQMLRLWRGKHEHRMSLLVVPTGDHGAWDIDLTAMFVQKCAQYRLPQEKRDGSKPAVCRPLPAEKGWLTDADLDHPKFEPAPFKEYKGDKDNAFWHFDEEMARAVYKYHKDKFLLPDPTKTFPVPADWPKK